MDTDFHFFQDTDGVEVCVEPRYSLGASAPDDKKHVWEYCVTIENRGAEPIRILERAWFVYDGNGQHFATDEEDDVLGSMPQLPPGASFQYNGILTLMTSTGVMTGNFVASKSGEICEIRVPMISLDGPVNQRLPN